MGSGLPARSSGFLVTAAVMGSGSGEINLVTVAVMVSGSGEINLVTAAVMVSGLGK